MITVMNGNEVNLKVTSIVLESNPDTPDLFSMFYCPKCGKPIFQYAGTIIMIVPGGTKVNIPIVEMCKGCKTRYLINSIM